MNWYVTGWQFARNGYVARVDQLSLNEFFWLAWLVDGVSIGTGIECDEFSAKRAALSAIDDHERSLT